MGKYIVKLLLLSILITAPICVMAQHRTKLTSPISKELLAKASQGDSVAQYNVGKYLDKQEKYTEAFAWYKKSAEKGYAPAQFEVGTDFEQGAGVDQDNSEAVKWFFKAAHQGYAPAQNCLGIMYEKGDGVDQDYYEAFNWYKKAALQGNADGQYNLGRQYENAYGTLDVDYDEAFKWYMKAAIQGLAYAQNSVGTLYYQGYGVDIDKGEAAKWFLKSARQGDEVAKNNLKSYDRAKARIGTQTVTFYSTVINVSNQYVQRWCNKYSGALGALVFSEGCFTFNKVIYTYISSSSGATHGGSYMEIYNNGRKVGLLTCSNYTGKLTFVLNNKSYSVKVLSGILI